MRSVGSLFRKKKHLEFLSQRKQVILWMSLVQTVSKAWGWHNLDGISFAFSSIVNAYIRPVPVLKNLRSKGFSTLKCMVRNCGPQILNLSIGSKMLESASMLEQMKPSRSGVCIASYESPNLEAFSLHVLRKNNCLELAAKFPEKHYVFPMDKFGGEDLSHEAAESGLKLAGDFRTQPSLGSVSVPVPVWYEPVFQVKV
uniref:Uncharacterized protein n=1 Tax=Salix viminalis TaxID=40686 RepID=A0A6N2LKP7_SALVM